MLLRAKFKEDNYTMEDFHLLYSYYYGNCFTFNGANRSLAVGDNEALPFSEQTVMVGPDNGLQLFIDIQQDQYLPSTDTAGLKVVINPQEVAPFPEDRAINVAPGMATSIALSKTEIVRQKSPYGPCQEVSKEQNKNLNIWSSEFSYSQTACLKTCYWRWVYFECGCCLSGYPCPIRKNPTTIMDEKIFDSAVPTCDTTRNWTHDCIATAEATRLSKALGCENLCPPPCKEEQFKTVISSGAWPSRNNFPSVIGWMKTDASARFDYTQTDDELYTSVQRNVLKLQVICLY